MSLYRVPFFSVHSSVTLLTREVRVHAKHDGVVAYVVVSVLLEG